MAVRVVTVDRNLKTGPMPILYGLALTLKNMFGTWFGGRSSTVQFPEEKRKTSGRYRGVHILTQRMDGTPKCVACYMCATVCPAECIYIESGERPERDIEKYPTRFEAAFVQVGDEVVFASPHERRFVGAAVEMAVALAEELVAATGAGR